MKKILFLLLLGNIFLCGQSVSSISDVQFERICHQLQMLEGENPELMIEKADSLYKTSRSDVHKFKALSIKASGYAALRKVDSLPEDLDRAIEANTMVFNERDISGNNYLNEIQKENKRISMFTRLLLLTTIALICILLIVYLKHKQKREEERVKYHELLKSIAEKTQEISVNTTPVEKHEMFEDPQNGRGQSIHSIQKSRTGNPR